MKRGSRKNAHAFKRLSNAFKRFSPCSFFHQENNILIENFSLQYGSESRITVHTLSNSSQHRRSYSRMWWQLSMGSSILAFPHAYWVCSREYRWSVCILTTAAGTNVNAWEFRCLQAMQTMRSPQRTNWKRSIGTRSLLFMKVMWPGDWGEKCGSQRSWARGTPSLSPGSFPRGQWHTWETCLLRGLWAFWTTDSSTMCTSSKKLRQRSIVQCPECNAVHKS